MNEKYIVQFVTLLGAAVASILLAFRVFNDQTDIVRALVILLGVILIFYIIGKIILRIMMRIHADIEEKERELMEAAEYSEEAEDLDNNNEEAAGEDDDDMGR